jgi:hypothetical protein
VQLHNLREEINQRDLRLAELEKDRYQLRQQCGDKDKDVARLTGQLDTVSATLAATSVERDSLLNQSAVLRVERDNAAAEVRVALCRVCVCVCVCGWVGGWRLAVAVAVSVTVMPHCRVAAGVKAANSRRCHRDVRRRPSCRAGCFRGGTSRDAGREGYVSLSLRHTLSVMSSMLLHYRPPIHRAWLLVVCVWQLH